ncbi:ribosome hibernation-promoting factor, HPF/YfiA family [Anaerostipes sp.]|uniref:ribosome hibernation-promoting factor, HPF/YfiA family n=1 Tax=Anaerostipes sp. TaxID=1872530 RepID=UPI0025C53BB3|nr:ribosome-associated translation inhibitor RaiA [Anaerostipes sp.]MBS7009336.1 ribosome-associated translation inhibitor RaiA [Anaerostipes sp.]
MNFIISGKNIEVTEGIKAAVEEKLGRLDKYLTDDIDIIVTLSVQKERQKIEVTIPMKGHIIRAEQDSADMYVSIDLVIDILERQIRRYKTRLMSKKYESAGLKQEFIDKDEDVDDDEIRIIRSKKFAIKPMDVEEACIQMDLLGHNFFVFRNADTFEVNVVYKRKGSTYGLIEPEF